MTNPPKQWSDDLIIPLAIWLLLLFPIASLLQHVIWITEGNVYSWVFPLAIFFTTVFVSGVFFQSNNWIKQTFHLALIGSTLLFASCLLCIFGYDFSWDGQGYHQHAVLSILEGFNPLYSREGVFAGTNAIWINSYPKGLWAASASVVSATGFIEAGRVYQWLAFIASVFLVSRVLEGVFHFPKIISFSGAAAIVSNPVILIQWHTYYVDGCLTLYTVCGICLVLIARDSGKWANGILCGAMIGYLPLIKYTGLWFGLCVAVFAFVQFWQYRLLIRLGLPALSVAVFVFVLGSSSSYLPNALLHSNPVYPIGTIDLVSWQAPKDYGDRPVLAQWWRSVQSRSSQTGNESISPHKNPWSLPIREEWIAYQFPYVQTGGWGPLFYASCCVTIVIALFIAVYNRQAAVVLLTFTCFLICSAQVIEGSWMSRYHPFTFYWPLLVVLLCCYYAGKATLIRSLGVLALSAWVSQGLAILYINTSTWQKNSHALRTQLRRIKTLKKEDYIRFTFHQEHFHGRASQERRLSEAGIRTKLVDVLDAKSSSVLIGSKGSVHVEDPNLKEATISDFVRWLSIQPLHLVDTSWYSDSTGNKLDWFIAFQGAMNKEEHGWHYHTMLPLWREYKSEHGLY